jgi:hypothetical protein
VLSSRADLRCLSLTGSEFEDAFQEYGCRYGRKDLGERNAKDVSDYLRFVNDSLTTHGLPELIVGTPRIGLRLDVHPCNVRYIPAPDNPFGETPGSKKDLRKKRDDPSF